MCRSQPSRRTNLYQQHLTYLQCQGSYIVERNLLACHLLYQTKKQRIYLPVVLPRIFHYGIRTIQLLAIVICKYLLVSFLFFFGGLVLAINMTFKHKVHNARPVIVADACYIFGITEIRECSTNLSICTYEFLTFFSHFVEHGSLVCKHHGTIVRLPLSFLSCNFHHFILPWLVVVA